MLLVIAAVVLLVVVALWRNWPRAGLITGICAVLLVVALIVFAAPGSIPARIVGGSWQGWLIAAVIVGVALAYGEMLRRLRGRAARNGALQSAQDTGPKDDPTRLSPTEIDRYARHIVLREIGGPGQVKLKQARVLVIGAGGLGSPALLYLAAAGVGEIGVVDDDQVALSNLQRQVLHRTADIGLAKTTSAATAMQAINPHVSVTPYPVRLDEDNAALILSGWDIVLDGTDSFASRHTTNRAAVAAGIPLVSGAITQWEGQLSVFDPARDAPCYACVFPREPADGLAPSCAQAGVIGALPGVVGAMMAVEAIKLVTGAGKPLRGDLLIYDALWGESRKIQVTRRAECPVCGGTLRRIDH